MKIIASYLRKRGPLLSGYFDDFLILGATVPICRDSIHATAALLGYKWYLR